MNNIYFLDIEADDLYPMQKNIWTIVIKKKDGEAITINPFNMEKVEAKIMILEFIFQDPSSIPTLVAHNGLGYDFWVLWKDLNISFSLSPNLLDGKEINFFDTLYASQFTWPDRPSGHSLENWGAILGDNKIDYRDHIVQQGLLDKKADKGAEFKFWTPFMDEYCNKDVIVCEKTYNSLVKEIDQHNSWDAFNEGQLGFYLMKAQEFTGFAFDKDKAEKLLPRIIHMMEDIKQEVDPLLPERPLKKGEQAFFTIPSTIYKQNGELGSHMVTFLERHNAVIEDGFIRAYDKVWKLEPKKILDITLPMNIEDQMELKDWFLDQGWEPTMWNIKRDTKGKPVRDENMELIKTTPKIQDAGKICSNLLELTGELPSKVVKFLSLRNRKGVIEGWLSNKRLSYDGRLSAASSGIASTHRNKHSIITNVPKAQTDVLLGPEFRELFTVDKGMKLIGCDQAALEARVQGHWTYPYDNGETARMLLEGDVHSSNCKAFYPEETKDFDINSPDFDKDHPGFKPYRSKSKNGGYAIMYGCAPPKLASTLGKPLELGIKLLESYWEANAGLKALKDDIERQWMRNGKKWISGVDGRRLYSRSKHSLVNLLFQSTGAITVDTSLILFHKKMGSLLLDDLGRPYYKYKNYIVKRVQYFHDEYGVECSEEIAKEVGEIMEWTMSYAGEVLNLNIELKGEAKIGNNWKETH